MRIVKTQTGITRIGIPWGTFQRATGISDIDLRDTIRCDVEIDENYQVTIELHPDRGRYKTSIEFRPESAHRVGPETVARVVNVHNNTLGTAACMPFGPIEGEDVMYRTGEADGEGTIRFFLPQGIRPLLTQPTAPRRNSIRDARSTNSDRPMAIIEGAPEAEPRPRRRAGRTSVGQSPIHDEIVRQRERPSGAGSGPVRFERLKAAAREMNAAMDEIKAHNPGAQVVIKTITDAEDGTIGHLSVMAMEERRIA